MQYFRPSPSPAVVNVLGLLFTSEPRAAAKSTCQVKQPRADIYLLRECTMTGGLCRSLALGSESLSQCRGCDCLPLSSPCDSIDLIESPESEPESLSRYPNRYVIQLWVAPCSMRARITIVALTRASNFCKHRPRDPISGLQESMGYC